MRRLPQFVPMMTLFLLGSMECRAQSATDETLRPPILPANTPVILRLKESLYKRDAKPGQPVEFEVSFDVVVNGEIFIQSGAAVTGSVRQVDNTGKGPAKVLVDLGPAQTITGEMVRLSGAGTTKDDASRGDDRPRLKDVGGLVAFDPEILPALPVIVPVLAVMELIPRKKVLLHKDASVVAHVAENFALDPEKLKAGQAQNAAKERAAQIELCRALQSMNPESSLNEGALLAFLLSGDFKTRPLRKAGDLDAAIEEDQQALALKPDCPELRFLLHAHLATVFEEKSDFAQAIDELQQALALKPDSPGLHVFLAKVFQENGDFVHAIAEYRTAVQLDPKDEHTREGFVTFLVESDDQDAALAEIKEAMRIWPDNIYFHFLLGRLLIKKNDPDGASAELQWALKQWKNHSWQANCELGRAYEQKGDLKAALGQYRTAYRVHMDDKECRAAYERLHSQLKN
jgi:tetratricopeptide (TPR) repeat protein